MESGTQEKREEIKMKTLREVPNRAAIQTPGDYFVSDTPGLAVILSCPFCGGLMHLSYEITQRTPLTVSLPAAVRHCGHDFFIENGTAREVTRKI